jgi:thiol-disulfide isomerase/thioredoxin
MTERLMVLAVVVGAVLALSIVARGWAGHRRLDVMNRVGLGPEVDGSTRILAFYGPSCDACDRQKIVLTQLASERQGQLIVDLRDASSDYDSARRFGLVIVPTTVVVRADGAIAAINSGFTARPILEAQLDAV